MGTGVCRTCACRALRRSRRSSSSSAFSGVLPRALRGEESVSRARISPNEGGPKTYSKEARMAARSTIVAVADEQALMLAKDVPIDLVMPKPQG